MAESTIPTTTATAEANGAPRREDTHESERFVSPAVDIFETPEGLSVVADLPGLDGDAIAVSVENDTLTIKGAPRQSVEREYLYREFEPLGYFRQFTLGNKIDRARINAEYRNGVLHLQLPFAEAAKPRQIEVRVAH